MVFARLKIRGVAADRRIVPDSGRGGGLAGDTDPWYKAAMLRQRAEERTLIMAMNFSETADRMDVRYVAALARISLADAEAQELQSQLDGILAYVGELKKLDVEGVPAFDDASGVRGAWHEDEPGECLPHDVAMSLAPVERHGQFVVPKIIE